jgi:hypothetical protein
MSRKPISDPPISDESKPGFYSHQFDEVETKDLEALLADGLQDEIDMLRVMMRRVMALAKGVEDQDHAVRSLGSLSLAAIRLARLLKIQKDLGFANDRTKKAISSAISSVMEMWNLSI